MVEMTIQSPRAPRAQQPQRPGPLRWLRYAFGGSLPAEYDQWVLYDTTGRTWVLRHLARALVQLTPFVVVVLTFVPGPFWIRTVAAVAATAMAVLFCFAYMVETTDRRLTKAGFAPGLGEALRRERSLAARYAGTAQRRAKIADRQGRRAIARSSAR
jgi:Family of unknown function (DUF5313)